MTGIAPQLRNVRLLGTATSRLSTPNANGVTISVVSPATFVQDAVVENCYVSKMASIGIMSIGGNRGKIIDNKVYDTYADGIHHTGGTQFFITSRNHIHNSGDDSIAVVSYQSDGVLCNNIIISENISLASQTRGITVIGGANISITGNTVNASTFFAVNVASEGTPYNTFGTSGINIVGNNFNGCLTSNSLAGGIVNVQGQAGSVSGISLSCTDTNISDNIFEGVGGTNAFYFVSVQQISSSTNINNNIFRGQTNAGYGIMYINATDVSIIANRLYNSASPGIAVDTACLGEIYIDGNIFNNVTTYTVNLINPFSGTCCATLYNNRNTDGANGATSFALNNSRWQRALYSNVSNAIPVSDQQRVQRVGSVYTIDLRVAPNNANGCELDVNNILLLNGNNETINIIWLVSAGVVQVDWLVCRDNNEYFAFSETDFFRLYAQSPTPTKIDGTGTGTAGTDYGVISAGNSYVQRRYNNTPFSNGSVGSITISSDGTNNTLTYTPVAANETVNLRARCAKYA